MHALQEELFGKPSERKLRWDMVNERVIEQFLRMYYETAGSRTLVRSEDITNTAEHIMTQFRTSVLYPECGNLLAFRIGSYLTPNSLLNVTLERSDFSCTFALRMLSHSNEKEGKRREQQYARRVRGYINTVLAERVVG